MPRTKQLSEKAVYTNFCIGGFLKTSFLSRSVPKTETEKLSDNDIVLQTQIEKRLTLPNDKKTFEQI